MKQSSLSTLTTVVGGLGLAFYFGALIWPLRLQVDYEAFKSAAVSAQVTRQSQIGIVGLTLAFAIVFLINSGKFLRRRPAPVLFGWAALAAWYLLSTAWSLAPLMTALYTATLLVILGVCAVFWMQPAEGRAIQMVMVAALIGLGMAYLAKTLGLQLRSFGGITANLIGHFGYTMIVLAAFAATPAVIASEWSPGKLLLAGLAVAGAGLIVYAQSRTLIISGAIFVIMQVLVLPRVQGRLDLSRLMWFGLPVAATAAIVCGTLLNPAVELLNRAIGISELAGRGADSGFTGRTSLWKAGITTLQAQLFTGYGFRTRGGAASSGPEDPTQNAHSGIINALLDGGLIGGGLFFAVYAASFIFLIVWWSRYRRHDHSVAASFLVAMVATLAIEPNYLNFAHPTSFLLVLCLGFAIVSPTVEHSVRRATVPRRPREPLMAAPPIAPRAEVTNVASQPSVRRGPGLRKRPKRTPKPPPVRPQPIGPRRGP